MAVELVMILVVLNAVDLLQNSQWPLKDCPSFTKSTRANPLYTPQNTSSPVDYMSPHANKKAYEVPFPQNDYYKLSYFPRTIRLECLTGSGN